MEGENGNVSDGVDMSNDAEATCQAIDDCAGVDQPHDVVAEVPEVVTTVNILVMNANVLLGKDPERLTDFRVLIASRNPKPDIIVIQKLGGTSGETDVRSKFRRGLRMYGCVFSQKVKLNNVTNRAGAGIMLL